MNGVLLNDHQFRGPSAIASGTVRAGTIVTHVKKGDWAAWVVLKKEDAPFFDTHDWTHRFVEVPETSVLPFGMKMYFIKGHDSELDMNLDLLVRAESPEEAEAFWRTHYEVDPDLDHLQSVKEVPVTGPAGPIDWAELGA